MRKKASDIRILKNIPGLANVTESHFLEDENFIIILCDNKLCLSRVITKYQKIGECYAHINVEVDSIDSLSYVSIYLYIHLYKGVFTHQSRIGEYLFTHIPYKEIVYHLSQLDYITNEVSDLLTIFVCLLALEAKVNTNLFKVSKQLFGFSETKNILFLVLLLNSIIIYFKELIWLPRCNAIIAWKKDRNIKRKDKLNKSEYMDRYLKSCHQQRKYSRQDKHFSKKNDLTISQKDQAVVLDDIIFELNSVQSENSLNEYQSTIE
ncbi:hypothetical protein C1646_752807 [Rhizophagus diaphanus]|nr:hypothetical protein C1646_752807 [Rhizophagus diaphanus] [Rhizophagus sp. MUCL 43196]